MKTAAVAHGNLTVSVDESVEVSQPGPFSRVGETVVTTQSEVNIEDVNRLRDALDKIELMLSESPLYAENAINESIDNALLLSHLEAMLDSVEQNMVDEDELSFLREVGCSSHKEQITQILLDIDDFEFELAHERISTLIQELK